MFGNPFIMDFLLISVVLAALSTLCRTLRVRFFLLNQIFKQRANSGSFAVKLHAKDKFQAYKSRK